VEARDAVGLLVGEVVDRPAENSEEFVEAVPVGPELLGIAEMPFAYARRIVTVLPENAREAGFRNRHADLAALLEPLGFVVAGHIRDADGGFEAADTMLISARQQRCPGGRTLRGVSVALQKAHALLPDGIDMRSADVGAPVAADVAVAEIVGKDQNHV